LDHFLDIFVSDCLGICYGHQAIAHVLGGKVTPGKHREFGKETITLAKRGTLFAPNRKQEVVWFSHGDQVKKLPKGAVAVASTATCAFAAYEDTKKHIYALQFHPEVTHTVHGKDMLKKFVTGICKAPRTWQTSTIADDIITSIKQTVGKEHVLVGISGGVDSLVAARLLHKAIGNQLHAVFVDTGLLRKDEVTEVSKALKKVGFKNLHVAQAAGLFLGRLAGVTDPEQKRKIIGHTFIEVFEKAMTDVLHEHPITFLAQGTIYPDRIESAAISKTGAKIKSHHNLTLPEAMKLKIIEPLKDLYKDEVRRVGAVLGLPHPLLARHPFPGPGLAIRVLGEVTEERLAILREADALYMQHLKDAGEYEKIWQAFAALLPVKTVGVMGDGRTYEYMLSLRAVDSVDGMSADWHKIPHALLEKISSDIVNKVRGVNRVVFDITQKPPGTIEYE
jgi:GMP synthase (glutamine-hydrolysing)